MKMGKLTTKKVLSLKEPGKYGDGEGLYLYIGPKGAKSWVLRTVINAKRRELGLGSSSLVTLAEARELARNYRKVARQGKDPDAIRKQKSISFEYAVNQVYLNLKPTWRSEKHAEVWLRSFDRFVFPFFRKQDITLLGTADILKVLTPIWSEKHDTAKRVKQRLRAVFDWAKGAGHYNKENPVEGIKQALPRIKIKVEHMPALDWQKAPDFILELRKREGVSARALEFLILTAARSGEVRGALWKEIYEDLWIIPANRMKTHKEHRVPLTKEAIECLNLVRDIDDTFIFPSPKTDKYGKGKPLSDVAFKSLMKRMGYEGITTHGFRSTFRDWCSDYAKADREVAEAALSHTFGNKVERAYARSDLFERRLKLMENWSSFLYAEEARIIIISKNR
jgi:integrase